MTDAERIKQLEAEASEWKWEYENVCKFTTGYEQQRDELREENRKLEAENLVMRDALVDLSKHNCGCYPICQCPMEYIDSVVDLAKDVLKKCQNTLQLQKEREADLAALRCAENVVNASKYEIENFKILEETLKKRALVYSGQ